MFHFGSAVVWRATIASPGKKRHQPGARVRQAQRYAWTYGRGESPGNPVAEFMYFVPLISLEPVSIVKSSGNTQRARMVSATRSFTARSFVVICEFEFAGEGNQQDVF